MILADSYMILLLICSFPAIFESVTGAAAFKSDCYRKSCMGKEYDIREAVCCENHLYDGAGLSCCGGQAYDKEEATCCKEERGRSAVTNGLSEKVSNCCGLKAYYHLNEICCQLTVSAKSAPKAECCGERAFDVDKQMCCGPSSNRSVLTRSSSDHLCCGHDQFNHKTECCCSTGDDLKRMPLSSSCCVEESAASESLCGTTAYNTSHQLCCQSTVAAKPTPDTQCCGKQTFNKDKQLCCGPTNDKRILEPESIHHLCCGHGQFNNKTERCCDDLKRMPLTSSCCEDSGAFDVDKQMCCGPSSNRSVLTRSSSDHLCCGHDQFNHKTECCCSTGDDLKRMPLSSSCCVEESAASESLCGTTAYNTSHQLCCQSTVAAKPTPDTQCCGKQTFNKDKQLCCGPTNDKRILEPESIHHLCCGHGQFNNKTERCCDDLKRMPLTSSCCEDSALCGTTAYNTSHQLCCQSTVAAKPTPDTQCCGKQTFNKDKQLCCGPTNDKRILEPESIHHLCCGHGQFNNKTECCCDDLKRMPLTSSCCEDSDTQQQKLAPQTGITHTNLCGSWCNSRSYSRGCGRKHRKSPWCCAPGRCADAPTVNNPHVCCDGCVAEKEPWIDQFPGRPGQHFCGTAVYDPHTQICCSGHRHHKKENSHCCGIKAYSVKDTGMKCCGGTLHSVMGGHEAQCCGSVLLTPQTVCCSSEDMEVLYSAKSGFKCCGHLHFNASLWSCCAGRLSPGRHPRQHQRETIRESALQSLNNLNEADLCKEMYVGTVESVSLHSVVLHSVLKINVRTGMVAPLASPHILQTPHHCSSPELTPGEIYFFDNVNVFTDFNHDSVHGSLHAIISKCYRD